MACFKVAKSVYKNYTEELMIALWLLNIMSWDTWRQELLTEAAAGGVLSKKVFLK